MSTLLRATLVADLHGATHYGGDLRGLQRRRARRLRRRPIRRRDAAPLCPAKRPRFPSTLALAPWPRGSSSAPFVRPPSRAFSESDDVAVPGPSMGLTRTRRTRCHITAGHPRPPGLARHVRGGDPRRRGVPGDQRLRSTTRRRPSSPSSAPSPAVVLLAVALPLIGSRLPRMRARVGLGARRRHGQHGDHPRGDQRGDEPAQAPQSPPSCSTPRRSSSPSSAGRSSASASARSAHSASSSASLACCSSSSATQATSRRAPTSPSASPSR